MAKKTWMQKIQNYITQSTWLPRISYYTPDSVWRNYRVETIDSKVHVVAKDKYDFTSKTKKYCFIKFDTTGSYYYCEEDYAQHFFYANEDKRLIHLIPRNPNGIDGYWIAYHSFGLVTHLFGVVGMMVLDVLAAIYTAPQLFYNLLTGNLTCALADARQVCLRTVNFLVKPLLWGGFVWSFLVGIFNTESAHKIYLGIEHDVYLGVFSLGPFTHLDVQENRENEPLLDLVNQVDEICPYTAYTNEKKFQHLRSLNVNNLKYVSDQCYLDEKLSTQNVIAAKAPDMKEGDTFEDSQLRVVKP